MHTALCLLSVDVYYHFSGLQIYYLSSASSDGVDEKCEQLGWKKLQEYDPSQKHWKYLSDFAEGNVTREEISVSEDEEENYYASLPFAALFSLLKVVITVLYGSWFSYLFSIILLDTVILSASWFLGIFYVSDGEL